MVWIWATLYHHTVYRESKREIRIRHSTKTKVCSFFGGCKKHASLYEATFSLFNTSLSECVLTSFIAMVHQNLLTTLYLHLGWFENVWLNYMKWSQQWQRWWWMVDVVAVAFNSSSHNNQWSITWNLILFFNPLYFSCFKKVEVVRFPDLHGSSTNRIINKIGNLTRMLIGNKMQKEQRKSSMKMGPESKQGMARPFKRRGCTYAIVVLSY